MPRLQVGQRVKLTAEALASDEATAALLTGQTGEITDIDMSSTLPIEVFFGECRDWYTWYFEEKDLQLDETTV